MHSSSEIQAIFEVDTTSMHSLPACMHVQQGEPAGLAPGCS